MAPRCHDDHAPESAQLVRARRGGAEIAGTTSVRTDTAAFTDDANAYEVVIADDGVPVVYLEPPSPDDTWTLVIDVQGVPPWDPPLEWQPELESDDRPRWSPEFKSDHHPPRWWPELEQHLRHLPCPRPTPRNQRRTSPAPRHRASRAQAVPCSASTTASEATDADDEQAGPAPESRKSRDSLEQRLSELGAGQREIKGLVNSALARVREERSSRLVSQTVAARLLGRRKSVVTRLVREGHLRLVPHGRFPRIPMSDLEKLFETGVPPEAAARSTPAPPRARTAPGNWEDEMREIATVLRKHRAKGRERAR